MAVSKKRSPYVKLENRAFQQVYDDLNDVIDNVNQYIDIKSSKSVIGDLVPNEDLSYNLGDENNSFKNVYAEKFYGDGSALTGISGGGGGSGDITEVASGGGLTGGSTSGVATLSHADTSSQISSDNSGQQFIQNITLDTYGHISSLTSSTATGGGGGSEITLTDTAPTSASDFSSVDIILEKDAGKIWWYSDTNSKLYYSYKDGEVDLNFTLNTFSDEISGSSHLIGSGNWKDQGAHTFAVSYNNGPPNVSAKIEEIQADPYLVISNETDTTPTNNVAGIPYPSSVGGTVKFRYTAEASSGTHELTEGTTHYFYNVMRWGIKNNSGSPSINEADINNLTQSITTNLVSRTLSSMPEAGSNDWMVYAYDDHYADLDPTDIRIGDYTAGFTKQTVADYTNANGFDSDFKVYVSNIAQLGSTDPVVDTTFPATPINHYFQGATSSAVGSIDPNTLTDRGSDSGLDTTKNWNNQTSGGNNLCIAYASRFGTISNAINGAFRIDDITANFETATASYQNAQGYTETFRFYRCVVERTSATYTLTSDNGSTIRNWQYVGKSSATASAGAIEALSNVDAGTSSFQTMSETISSLADSEKIWVAYPSRYTDPLATDFRLEGMTAGFTKDGSTYSVTNENGFAEDYDLWTSNLTGVDLDSSILLLVNTFYSSTPMNQIRTGSSSSTLTTEDHINSTLTTVALTTTSNTTANSSYANITGGIGQYVYIAIPTGWNITADEFQWNPTGSNPLGSIGMTETEDSVSWTNPAGFAETYAIWRSTKATLGEGKISAYNGVTPITQYWWGTNSTQTPDEGIVQGLGKDDWSATNSSQSISTTHFTGSGDYLNTSAGKYVHMAFPSNWTDIPTSGTGTGFTVGTSGGSDFVTALFTKTSSLDVKNDYDWSDNYEVYTSSITHMLSGANLGIKTYSTARLVNYYYWGVSTDTTSSGWDLSDLGGLGNSAIVTESANQTDGQTSSFHGDPRFTVDVGAGEYLYFVYPTRYGTFTYFLLGALLSGGMDFGGSAGTIETLSVTNKGGFVETYNVVRSDNTQLGAGTTVKITA